MYGRSDMFVFKIVFVFALSLFILYVLSLSGSLPIPRQLSAGRFLLVSRVLLKVSS